MASNESDASLTSLLADAEAALLFARVNEKRLSEENHRYRERCEQLSMQLLEAAAVATTAKPPRPRKTSSSLDHDDRVLNLFLTDGKHLTERKVPGLVSAPKGALEFGTVSATVTGVEFVGFRPLKHTPGSDAASSSKPVHAHVSMSDRAAQLLDMLHRTSTDSTEGEETTLADEDGGDGGRLSVHRRLASDATKRDGSDIDEQDMGSAHETSACGGTDSAAEDALGTYEIMWKEGGGMGPLRRLAFECNRSGLAYVERRVREWSAEAREGGSLDARERTARDSEDASKNIRDVSRGASLDEKTGYPVSADATTSASSGPEGNEGKQPKTRVVLPLGKHPVRLSESSSIFSEHDARRLQGALPARLRLRDWNMAYSSKRDGISLRSLYRAAAKAASPENGSSRESFLFVKDSRGNVFGAFAAEPWHAHQRYYGTGESFVFAIAASEDAERNTKKTTENVVTAFRWSRKNDYFMFCRGDCAAVGGGNGFALWLDEDLLRGNSAPSDTFDNPCLSGGVKDFEITYVELWTFAARPAS